MVNNSTINYLKKLVKRTQSFIRLEPRYLELLDRMTAADALLQLHLEYGDEAKLFCHHLKEKTGEELSRIYDRKNSA